MKDIKNIVKCLIKTKRYTLRSLSLYVGVSRHTLKAVLEGKHVDIEYSVKTRLEQLYWGRKHLEVRH